MIQVIPRSKRYMTNLKRKGKQEVEFYEKNLDLIRLWRMNGIVSNSIVSFVGWREKGKKEKKHFDQIG